MAIEVEGPDGAVIEFPQGTDNATIQKAMAKHYGAPKAAAAVTPAKPGILESAFKATGIPAIASEFSKASDAFNKDMSSLGSTQRPSVGTIAGNLASEIAHPLAGPIATAGKLASAASNVGSAAAVPVTAPLHQAFGQKAGDLIASAIPFAGEAREAQLAGQVAKEAGVGQNTMRTALRASKAAEPAPATSNALKVAAKAAAPEDADYAKAVADLQKEGVSLTRGMSGGKGAKSLEEAMKSNPFTREGTVQAERDAFDSLNRAAYNRALSPVGLKYDPKGPVGYQGIKRVGQTLGTEFDKLIPDLKLVQDKHLAMDLDDIKQDVSELPKAQQEQYETIMRNRFFSPLVKKGGQLNGQDFKDMESGLSQEAADWKSSGDPAQRKLGHALDASLGALRDNLERTSNPNVRDRLKAVNTGWANFVRLQGAAANRVTSEGRFTPGDLLSSVKRSDKSVRKGAFARGDALLQDLGTNAQKVMGNTIPDSGTGYRLAQLARMGGAGGVGAMVGHIPGALVGMAAEPATNALARAYAAGRASEAAPSAKNMIKMALGQAQQKRAVQAAKVAPAQNALATQIRPGQPPPPQIGPGNTGTPQ